MRILLLLSALVSVLMVGAQSYTYYPTGDTTDVNPITTPGTCLMGGATEHDNAMIWFLERAGGGNILVIRASGSDGYNDYMYSELGVNVQSVETIVFNSAAAANDPFVLDRISKAEAIWMAGGDQWDYVSYWRDSAVGQLLNSHILQKHAPIGGTSAGMAIAGGVYFSAENGTITSSQALSNPYHPNLTLGYEDFLHMHYLQGVVTDTHYDDPDRRGRHVAFLARMAADEGIFSAGIACDEYTAVCIDDNGIATCYGEWPAYDEDIYFLQANCETSGQPEICEPGSPLTWNQEMAAVKVYRVKGTLNGENSFDISDWLTGEGGEWENWWVVDGELMTSEGTAPDCATGLGENGLARDVYHYNPVTNILHFEDGFQGYVRLFDALGRHLYNASYTNPIDLSPWNGSVLLIRFESEDGIGVGKVVVE